MSDKTIGEKIGAKAHTFGRKESNPHNTSAVISVGSIEGVESNTEYFFKMKPQGNTQFSGDIDPFIRKTHDAKESFSITHSMIREYGIKPGQNFYIDIHEVDESKDLDDIAQDIGDGSTNTDKPIADKAQTQKEKIDEMYEMVSELYEAYTAAKND